MIVARLIPEVRSLQVALRRNYGASAVLLKNVADPVQQLFVDKIREYSKKKATAGDKFVDSNAGIEKELEQELTKVAKQYGGGEGVDMTKFPTFEFVDPKIDAVV